MNEGEARRIGSEARSAFRDGRRRFLYVAETDLSIDNGPGINEREFVDAVTRHWPNEVICVAPEPMHPDTYRNPSVRYAASHGRSAAAYPRYLASAFRLIKRILAEHEITGIAFRFGPTPILPFLFSRGRGPRMLLKTFAPNAALGPEMKLGPVRRAVGGLLRPAYRSVVRRAVAADTVSAAYRDWICDRYDIVPERIALIPNGASTDLFTPGDGSGCRRALRLERFDRVVGYVGALSAIRYLDVLIRSLARVRRTENTALVLVGDGDQRSSLESLARRLGVGDRVVFVGSVPYATVAEYIRAFDVAVDLTSVEMSIGGRTVLSSFSQKIPQCLACGVPVVAWRCPDTGFLLERDVGRLAAFRDEEELSGALVSILARTREQRAAMGRRARALVESRLSTVRLAEQRLDWWRAVTADVRGEPDTVPGS